MFTRPAVWRLRPGPSSAERGDISVAEIRQQQAREVQAEQQKLQLLIEEAQTAERVGRYGAARVRYKQAALLAEGELRKTLLAKHASLAGK